LDEAIRRRRNLYLLGAGAFLALEALLVVSSMFMRRHEQVLDRVAVRTEAVVKDSRRYRLRPEGAAVRYEVDRRVIETILTVNDADDFVEGERVTVEYDPRNPRHARPLEGWEPTYETLVFFAVLAAVALPVVAGPQAWRDLRAARAAREGQTSTMHGLVYTRWRLRWGLPYVWLGTEFLVALWPVGASVSRPPEMAVAIHDDDEFPQGAVTVHGRAEPGGRVILEAGGKIFWPRRKVRRELPDTAQPLDVTTKR